VRHFLSKYGGFCAVDTLRYKRLSLDSQLSTIQARSDPDSSTLPRRPCNSSVVPINPEEFASTRPARPRREAILEKAIFWQFSTAAWKKGNCFQSSHQNFSRSRAPLASEPALLRVFNQLTERHSTTPRRHPVAALFLFRAELDRPFGAVLSAFSFRGDVQANPVALTRRDGQFDRADKRPLTAEELRAYWQLIEKLPGLRGRCLRLHLLTGGQRIEQLVRLRWADVRADRSPSTTPRAVPGKVRAGTPCRSPRLPRATCLRPSATATTSSPRRRASSRSLAKGCR
jgi:integrase